MEEEEEGGAGPESGVYIIINVVTSDVSPWVGLGSAAYGQPYRPFHSPDATMSSRLSSGLIRPLLTTFVLTSSPRRSALLRAHISESMTLAGINKHKHLSASPSRALSILYFLNISSNPTLALPSLLHLYPPRSSVINYSQWHQSFLVSISER